MSYTGNKLNLFSPPNGSYVGSWDEPLYANWYAIDGALGGTTSITLSNLDVTLVEGQFPNPPGPGDIPYNPAGITNSAQNIFIALTGTLSANVSVNLPAGKGGIWIFYNGTTATSNNYTVSVKSASPGSNSIVLPNGLNSFIASNGFTVGWADNGNVAANVPNQSIPAGSIIPFAGTVTPSGYLFCDGSVVPIATYPALYTAIGTTWNTTGEGAGNFRLPDFQDMFLRGSGASAVGVYEADDFKAHTHAPTVTDPGHNHTTAVLATANSIGNGDVVTGVTGSGYQNIAGALTTTKTTGVTVSNASTGGTETRPKNKRVLYIIKT